jgi:hypothetical protein
MKEFGGVFVKLPWPGNYQIERNYFSIENSMKYVHDFMDRVHDNAVHRLTDFIKSESSKSRWRAWVNRCEEV